MSAPTSSRSVNPALPPPDDILHALGVGVMTVAADGRVRWCNPAAERLLGAYLVGSSLDASADPRWQWVDPDGREVSASSHPIARAVRTRLSVADECIGIVGVGGRLSWLRISVSACAPVHGKAGHWVVTFCEVTQEVEQRRREEALRLQLTHVLTGANDGYWDWNVGTGEVAFSTRWASMLGYGVDEVPTHVDSWAKLVHPDDLPAVMSAVEAHLQGETAFYESEHRLRHRDGHWIWVLVRGKVVEHDRSGRPRRACGTHSDVTRRHEVEAANAALLKDLEHSLANIRQLTGLLPICAWCKRLRSDAGYWTELEEYLRAHTNAEVTHGICPECETRFSGSRG